MAKEKIYTHMAIPRVLTTIFGGSWCPVVVLRAGVWEVCGNHLTEVNIRTIKTDFYSEGYRCKVFVCPACGGRSFF